MSSPEHEINELSARLDRWSLAYHRDDKPLASDAEYDRLEQSLPEVFVDTLTCGITNKIMKKPVVAADGYTYEKEAILKWMMQSSLSPIPIL